MTILRRIIPEVFLKGKTKIQNFKFTKAFCSFKCPEVKWITEDEESQNKVVRDANNQMMTENRKLGVIMKQVKKKVEYEYSCLVCQNSLKSKAAIKKHIERKHIGGSFYYM